MITAIARNWWALAVRGLFAVLFGIAAFIWPGMALRFLIALFGLYALLDGLFALIAGYLAAETHRRSWPLIVSGLAGIAVGVLTYVRPAVTALVLLYYISFWAVLTGVLGIAAAIRLRREIENEWFLGISGAASVLFGLYIVVAPGAGALALLWLIGIYALAIGILLLALAFRLRGWTRAAPAQRRAPA